MVFPNPPCIPSTLSAPTDPPPLPDSLPSLQTLSLQHSPYTNSCMEQICPFNSTVFFPEFQLPSPPTSVFYKIKPKFLQELLDSFAFSDELRKCSVSNPKVPWQHKATWRHYFQWTKHQILSLKSILSTLTQLCEWIYASGNCNRTFWLCPLITSSTRVTEKICN